MGSFALHDIKGVSTMVIFRSRSLERVRVAIIAGTLHPNKRAAGKPDFPQQFVHDKSHTRHIPAVFQKREEEKQENNDRKKGEYAPYAGANAVNDQRMHPFTDANVGEQCGKAVYQEIDAGFE